MKSFSYSSQAWVCSNTVMAKVGAEFAAYCCNIPHPAWGWEGVVLFYMSFHVYGISPTPQDFCCVVVNITTFLTKTKLVPVDLNQHSQMRAVIYFSLAPPPNYLFHRLSMVALVILISSPQNDFFLCLAGYSAGLWFDGITTNEASSKDQTNSEQFYLHQKLGSKSRGVENPSQSLCVGRRSTQGLTYCNMRQEARGGYAALCTSSSVGLR